MNMPSVGDPAPEIKLAGDDGTMHHLAHQRGRWTVVYFYPADDTPGCTTEACQFRDTDDVVRDAGADVWGIGPDDLASHRRFRDKFSLNFTLLSDEDHVVAEAYGAWTLKSNYGREYMGIQRSTFLVDPDGRIAHVWPKVKADGHAAEVVAELARGRERRGATRT